MYVTLCVSISKEKHTSRRKKLFKSIYTYAFRHDDGRAFYREGDEMNELDSLDRDILALLQEDARLPNRAIAVRVGSSEPTVRRRIDRMIEDGLIKIVAVASPFALGHTVMAILGLQIDRSYQSQIEEALRAIPEVRFVGLTLGAMI
jgi:hypothetical protein